MDLFSQVTYTTTTVESTGGGISMGFILLWLALFVVSVIALWRVFTKAGEAGWLSIIPIVNTLFLLKIAKRPMWWIILLLIPVVNIIIWLIVSIDLAKVFGKSTVFGVVGIWLFSIIGLLILGYGDAKYEGGSSNSSSGAATPPPAPAAPAAS